MHVQVNLLDLGGKVQSLALQGVQHMGVEGLLEAVDQLARGHVGGGVDEGGEGGGEGGGGDSVVGMAAGARGWQRRGDGVVIVPKGL